MQLKKYDSWATFFKTFQRVHQKILSELKQCDVPDLETYDVLWTLEQAPSHFLRPHDLAEQVYLARFNLSRLCVRLLKLKLIERRICPDDRRGHYIALTEKGLKLRLKMWQVYADLIEKNYSTYLTEQDHKEIKKILNKVSNI